MGAQEALAEGIRRKFQAAGFEIAEAGQAPATLEVKKHNCTRRLSPNGAGVWVPAGPPCFLVRGLACELEDRGYQKFWYHDGQRFPIRVGELKTLQGFDQEVREILGLTSLYNESLGSTCARTVYDRLDGRPDQ
jgi:hypothetical protein